MRKKSRPAKNSNSPLIPIAIEQERQRQHKQNLEDAIIADINWQWRTFALGIMNGKANYTAYNEAYKIGDVDNNHRAYMVASACAARLLKNAKFREYWRELLGEQGFNHDVVDSQMLKQITSPDTPENVRRAAIRDYNELNGRIVQKTDITSKGRRVQSPLVISPINSRKK